LLIGKLKINNFMGKEVNNILKRYKDGELTLDKTRRMIFVLTGVLKTDSCTLDRVKEECSVFLHTTLKCDGCFYKC